jgi:putative peptidoglycan lipid II flippase
VAGLIAQPDVSQQGRLRRGRTVGVVSVLTVVVAVCGYLREAALAARFGVSATMDAYFSAIFIPTIVYMVLIAGTLSPVFIPILLQRDINEDRTELSETFSIVTNFVVLLLAAIVCCAMITARMWLQLLFPGFNAETVGITLRLIYIIFPSVLFVAMAGLLTAVLNGFRKFALAAIAPALSSITVVVAVTISRGPQDIYMVGIATAIGFLLQLLLLIPAIFALGIRYRLVFNFRHPTIGKLLRLGGPLLLYLVVANASLFLERNLASRLSAGAVSTVTYVMRLFTVPSNFLAAPLAVVAYPLFAREALREKWGDLGSKVSRMFRLVLFIFMPVTLWTVLNALPLTRILYERGAFRYADSVLTARIFSLYGIGILPNALAVALLPCFYAMQDTISPLWAEAVNFLFYLVAAIFLVNHFGLLGLAISRGVQFYLFAAMLIFVLFRRRLLEIDSTLWQFVSRVGLASLTMGLVTCIVLHLVRGAFDAGILPVRLGIVFVMGVASGAVYLSVTRLLKLSEAAEVLNAAIDLLPWRRVIPVQ